MTRATALLAAACLCLATSCSSPAPVQAPPSGATVFEGARLITGDGGPPIEDSAFIVDDATFLAVGRRGEVQIPPGRPASI